MSDTNEPPDGGKDEPPSPPPPPPPEGGYPPPPPSGGYPPPQPPPQQPPYGQPQPGQPQYGQPQYGQQGQQWAQPYQQQYMGATEKVPNYLVQAILVTLFCCLPAGVVAIVFAAQVNGKVEAGDIAGARSASRNAKIWSWVSFGVGLGLLVLYIGFIVLLGALGSTNELNNEF